MSKPKREPVVHKSVQRRGCGRFWATECGSVSAAAWFAWDWPRVTCENCLQARRKR